MSVDTQAGVKGVRGVKLIQGRMAKHIKLCRKNLKSKRVKCCATCPFEEFIVAYDADLRWWFDVKRMEVNKGMIRK